MTGALSGSSEPAVICREEGMERVVLVVSFLFSVLHVAGKLQAGTCRQR